MSQHLRSSWPDDPARSGGAADRAGGLISVVVPCFNEEAVIARTHGRLYRAMQESGHPFELVYVNDGSRDQTLEVLHEIVDQCAEAHLVNLSRNFGHQMAVTAGIDYARGAAVVLIDADLQDPPEVIPEMIRRWIDGDDVVYGQRRSRAGETFGKKFNSKLFYRIISAMSDTKIPVDTGDFRLMDRQVVSVLSEMPEQDRYLRGMVSWVGFRQSCLQFDREPRAAGETKYSQLNLVRLALAAMVSFSMIPLRIAAGLGVVCVGFTMLGIVAAVFARLSGWHQLEGQATTLVSVLFLGGVQLICLGIMGEYLGRIYREVKQRPLYVVSETRKGRDGRGPRVAEGAEADAEVLDRGRHPEREEVTR